MRKPPAPPTRRMLTCSLALYRLLLLVYPASFRRTYGAEMLQVFRASCRQAVQEQGVWGMLGVWLSTFPDVVITAFAERLMEGQTMTRFWLIRICGLLTLIGAVLFSLLMLDGEISSRLIPGYPGLLNVLVNALPHTTPVAGEFVLLQLVSLGILFIPALCFVFGTLGIWLLQRSQLGKIAGGLAFLGPLVSGFLWLFIPARSLLLIALVLLGLGLLLCGALTLRFRLLPRWNALPLLLGLCLVAYSLRLVIWALIPVPGFVVQQYAFFATTGYLVFFVLWGCLGFVLWARKAGQPAQVVPSVC